MSELKNKLVYQIFGTLQSSRAASINENTSLWQPPPACQTSHGKEGWMAYDDSYLYIYTNGAWRRVALALFS